MINLLSKCCNSSIDTDTDRETYTQRQAVCRSDSICYSHISRSHLAFGQQHTRLLPNNCQPELRSGAARHGSATGHCCRSMMQTHSIYPPQCGTHDWGRLLRWAEQGVDSQIGKKLKSKGISTSLLQ